MRKRQAFVRLALSFALGACARAERPPRALDVPPPQPTAKAPVVPAPRPKRPEARIAASLFDAPFGGYEDKRIVVEPPLVDLVRPCYERALETDPTTAGWAIVDISLGLDRSTTHLDRASGLPDALTACMVQRLRLAHFADPGWFGGPTYFVYISLG